MSEGLLVEGLRAGYGDLAAVWDVSFTVTPGRIVAFVGRNGAGKSTTINAIAGLIKPMRGTISLNGTDITRLSASERAKRGIGAVPEGRRIFRPLTVDENLRLGTHALRNGRKQGALRVQQIYDQFPVLAERRATVAGSLSGGQQQILAIAQALVASPTVLLVDEPTAGLAPGVVQSVFEIFSLLAGAGIGILVAEERADYLEPIADEVFVFEQGRMVIDQIPHE